MAEHDLRKQQKEYIAVGFLVLVALFIGISRFKKKKVDDNVFSSKRFSEEWKEVEMLESNLPEEEKGVKYVLDDEATPFKNPITDKKKMEVTDEEIFLPSMAFQGMIWNSRRPQAIINGKVYDVNDVIEIGGGGIDGDRVKVRDITREGISLRYRGKDFIVRPK